MNLVITLDKNYLQHAAVMLRSLLATNAANKCTLFVICDERINTADWNKLEEVYKNSSLQVVKINIDPNLFKGFKLSEHATYANYYRIELANLIPKNINKLLYLDVDIVVNQDLAELYATDIGNYFLAAVEDPIVPQKVKLGLNQNEPYFNSGVMLINLEAWRNAELNKKLAAFIIENPDKISFWDQDAFNALCIGKWKPLLPKFNFQSVFFTLKNGALTYNYTNVKEGMQQPVIIHYTGMSKPWKYMDRHPRKSDYYKFLKETPWKDYQPDDKSFANRIRKYGFMPGFMEQILKRK